jgi:cytochrome bd-type quinol oxidase subunit 2
MKFSGVLIFMAICFVLILIIFPNIMSPAVIIELPEDMTEAERTAFDNKLKEVTVLAVFITVIGFVGFELLFRIVDKRRKHDPLESWVYDSVKKHEAK